VNDVWQLGDRTMRMFLLLAALATTSSVALSQPTSTYSRAFPPSQEALDRLNLKSDWTLYVPVSGQADGLAKVQILDEDQIAIQTKSGVLLLVDEGTGRQQWKFKYPGHFTSGYKVAVNEKYLFAVNVAKLYCFHRYSGLLEFEFDLPEAPSTGPLADNSQVYVALSGSKLMAFQLPLGVQISNDSVAKKVSGAPPDNSKIRNPADVVADRYSTRTNLKSITDEFDRTTVPKAYLETGSGASSTARSPSISTLASVVPPYTLHGPFDAAIVATAVPTQSGLPHIQPIFTFHCCDSGIRSPPPRADQPPPPSGETGAGMVDWYKPEDRL
jgi:PQQ-like domain